MISRPEASEDWYYHAQPRMMFNAFAIMAKSESLLLHLGEVLKRCKCSLNQKANF